MTTGLQIISMIAAVVIFVALFIDTIENVKDSFLGIIWNGAKSILLTKIGWPEKKKETLVDSATRQREELLESKIAEYIAGGLEPQTARALAYKLLDKQAREQFKDDFEKSGGL